MPLRQQVFKAAGTEQPHTETTNKNLVALPSQSLPPLYIKCVTPNPTTATSSVTQRFQLLKDSNYALVYVGHTAGLLVQCH